MYDVSLKKVNIYVGILILQILMSGALIKDQQKLKVKQGKKDTYKGPQNPYFVEKSKNAAHIWCIECKVVY